MHLIIIKHFYNQNIWIFQGFSYSFEVFGKYSVWIYKIWKTGLEEVKHIFTLNQLKTQFSLLIFNVFIDLNLGELFCDQ